MPRRRTSRLLDAPRLRFVLTIKSLDVPQECRCEFCVLLAQTKLLLQSRRQVARGILLDGRFLILIRGKGLGDAKQRAASGRREEKELEAEARASYLISTCKPIVSEVKKEI